jgi:serine protease Do
MIKAIDTDNDLCLIDKPEHGLKPMPIVDHDSVYIRDRVFTVGAPSLPFPIESEGYVSIPALSSNSPRLNGKIMCSLPIYSGNSGSPLLNELGEVIGVIVMGDRDYNGVAIATPAKALRAFLKANEAN